MVPEKDEIQKILDAIQANSNYNLSDYSINSISRRFGKVLLDLKITVDELIKKLEKDDLFIEKIIKRITVNTTELFRDPAIWVNLRNNVLPLFEDNKKLRIWHPGCSTGQEIYSMMILLHDMGWLEKSHIYASDINQDVIEISRKGEYKLRFHAEYLKNFDKTLNPETRIPKLKYETYFEIDYNQDLIKMKDFLVTKPGYRVSDLVSGENPFVEKFDIIICRNVIIYFNYELQNRVLELFRKCMNPDAFLLLGLHESIIGPAAAGFIKKEGVYFRK